MRRARRRAAEALVQAALALHWSDYIGNVPPLLEGETPGQAGRRVRADFDSAANDYRVAFRMSGVAWGSGRRAES